MSFKFLDLNYPKSPRLFLKIRRPTEHFFVNLSNPLNAGIADGQAMVTIIDNDHYHTRVANSTGDDADAVTERKVVVSPNPFVNKIRISIQSPVEEKATLLLLDLSGRQLATKPVQLAKGNNLVMLEGLEKLAAGAYFLHIVSENRREVHKLIRQAN